MENDKPLLFINPTCSACRQAISIVQNNPRYKNEVLVKDIVNDPSARSMLDKLAGNYGVTPMMITVDGGQVHRYAGSQQILGALQRRFG